MHRQQCFVRRNDTPELVELSTFYNADLPSVAFSILATPSPYAPGREAQGEGGRTRTYICV